ncbi:MAG: hypothetical protein ACHBN1_35285 [Heteroscytonema crispum UTEX LB 1556]
MRVHGFNSRLAGVQDVKLPTTRSRFTIPGTRENATCSTWGDPKTAVAPLPRAPLHQLPTNN